MLKSNQLQLDDYCLRPHYAVREFDATARALVLIHLSASRTQLTAFTMSAELVDFLHTKVPMKQVCMASRRDKPRCLLPVPLPVSRREAASSQCRLACARRSI